MSTNEDDPPHSLDLPFEGGLPEYRDPRRPAKAKRKRARRKALRLRRIRVRVISTARRRSALLRGAAERFVVEVLRSVAVKLTAALIAALAVGIYGEIRFDVIERVLKPQPTPTIPDERLPDDSRLRGIDLETGSIDGREHLPPTPPAPWPEPSVKKSKPTTTKRRAAEPDHWSTQVFRD